MNDGDVYLVTGFAIGIAVVAGVLRTWGPDIFGWLLKVINENRR